MQCYGLQPKKAQIHEILTENGMNYRNHDSWKGNGMKKWYSTNMELEPLKVYKSLNHGTKRHFSIIFLGPHLLYL